MERCTLCGGRLANGKCTECGLDNTKNDKMYRLNVHNEKGMTLHLGDCEDHLNRESDWRMRMRRRQKKLSGAAGKGAGESPVRTGTAPEAARQSRRRLKERSQTGTVRERRPLAVILIWTTVILIAAAVILQIISSVADLGKNSLGDLFVSIRSETVRDEPEVPAAPAWASWDEDSENYFELELAPGFYTAGYEIPAGSCQFACLENSSDIYWQNPEEEYENYVLLYSREQQESYEDLFEEKCPYFQYSKVIDLEDGAVVRVDSGGSGTVLTGMSGETGALRAHGAQAARDTVVLEDGMTAGEDFAEGVYDLMLDAPESADDYMSVYAEVSGENRTDTLFLNVNTLCGQYLRVPFRKGDTVALEKYSEEAEACVVRLVPSY